MAKLTRKELDEFIYKVKYYDEKTGKENTLYEIQLGQIKNILKIGKTFFKKKDITIYIDNNIYPHEDFIGEVLCKVYKNLVDNFTNEASPRDRYDKPDTEDGLKNLLQQESSTFVKRRVLDELKRIYPILTRLTRLTKHVEDSKTLDQVYDIDSLSSKFVMLTPIKFIMLIPILYKKSLDKNGLSSYCDKCSNCNDKKIRLDSNFILLPIDNEIDAIASKFSEESKRKQVKNKSGNVIEKPCNIGIKYYYWKEWCDDKELLELEKYVEGTKLTATYKKNLARYETLANTINKQNKTTTIPKVSLNLIKEYFMEIDDIKKVDIEKIIEYTKWKLNNCEYRKIT